VRVTHPRAAALTFVLAAAACAKIEPPPGGPKDLLPPGLIATVPESLAVLPDFSGDVQFIFNETVSEGNSPNMGLGTGDLERLVILSPTTRNPKVSWKRSRVTVRPAEGWQPNRVYRVQLLPGVMDLRRNRSDSTRVVTFTTGAPLPTLHFTGQVWDWTNAHPLRQALVEALLLPDSLPYRMVTDSNGRFDFGPLPGGDYLLYGVLDQNHNNQFDRREAWDSARMTGGSSAVPELWVFPHDTVGPKLNRAAMTDSLTATLTFNQPVDPRQRFQPQAVRLILPDSTRVTVVSLLPKAEHDSLYAPPAPPPDSAALKKPAAALPPPSAKTPPAARADTVRPSRAALYSVLYLRTSEPFRAGVTYLVEVDSVRNANGAVANARGPLEIPKAKPDSTNSHPDSTAKPGSTPAKPKKPAP